MVWPYIVQLVIAYAVSYFLAPKPQNAKPASFKDIQAPTAEEGIEIGVLFGTRDIAPNCVWYGDLRTVPIRKKGGKK